jgi:hypothetical protein
VFSHSVHLPVTPQQAWVALQDPATWGAIGGVDGIGSVELHTSGDLERFTFSTTVASRSYPGTASVAHRRHPSEMTVAIATSELNGTIAVLIAPSHAPDHIAVTLDVRSRSLLASMMFPLIVGAIGNGFPERVDAFANGLASD